MHLLIPHASALDEAARHAFSGLALPHLTAQLARLSPAETWGSDEYLARSRPIMSHWPRLRRPAATQRRRVGRSMPAPNWPGR